MSLTGGLGNQLFQLAAGLNLARNGELTLVTELGAPRTTKDGRVELLALSLPKDVKIYNAKRANWIVKKTAGFMLRYGFAPTQIEKSGVFVFFSQLFANIIMTIYFGFKVTVLPASDVGFSHINIAKEKVLLLGYFQSYKWAKNPQTLRQLKSIAFHLESEEINQYVKDAETELPLIVHVRLGDYLTEKNFGIPSKDYYKRGISKLLSTEKYKSLWIFSDD